MIKFINWPKDLKICTFRSNTCLVYVEDVQREILNKSKYPPSKKSINVKIFDISWLISKDRTFADFVADLIECKSNSIFTS